MVASISCFLLSILVNFIMNPCAGNGNHVNNINTTNKYVELIPEQKIAPDGIVKWKGFQPKETACIDISLPLHIHNTDKDAEVWVYVKGRKLNRLHATCEQMCTLNGEIYMSPGDHLEIFYTGSGVANILKKPNSYIILTKTTCLPTTTKTMPITNTPSTASNSKAKNVAFSLVAFIVKFLCY